MGGKYLSISNVHNLLTNPFYAGILEWGDECYPGSHEPMVTLDEFERVQRFLRRHGKPSPKKHFFPFTALIRCGACDRMVTAENKIRKNGGCDKGMIENNLRRALEENKRAFAK